MSSWRHNGLWIDAGTGESGVMRTVVVVALVAGSALVCAGGAAAANTTTLSINCTPKGVSLGSATSCVATVTDAGPAASRVPPTGTVTFTTDGAGTFDPGDTCTIDPAGAFSSKCTLAYTATAISGGSHRLFATYNGDDGHGRATSAFQLAVTPANDDITTAAPLAVPGTLTGTTEGATYSESDPELCSDAYAPVWYSLKPARSGRVAVRLTVKGRVDAVVAVFRQDRTELVPLGCDVSDAAGVAGVPFNAAAGTSYVVAVAAPWSATSGAFRLDSFIVPPVAFPGTRVAHDADLALDPLLRPSAALSVPVRAGTSYRIDATARSACVHVGVLARPLVDARERVASDGCSGYVVYTPRPGAPRTLPLLVNLPEGGAATVHVAIRPVQVDDLAPGRALPVATVHRDRLSSRDADVVDIFNFGVTSTSDATITLHGTVQADLLIFDRQGRQLGCACDGSTRATVDHRLGPGTYLAVVRARPGVSGGYSILVRLRHPTSTSARLGSTVGSQPQLAVTATVSPANVGGRAQLELERFDPLSGWQFVATVDHAAAAGRTTFTLRPRLGAWRVRTSYRGTLSASPSASDWITFTLEPSTGSTGAAHRAVACGPASAGIFALASLTLTCGSSGFGTKPSTPSTKSASAELRDLRATVAGLATLKEPFKSRLVENLDAAIQALAAKNNDEARAQLDDFVSALQSQPVAAQLTADQRNGLIATAKQIEAQIGA